MTLADGLAVPARVTRVDDGDVILVLLLEAGEVTVPGPTVPILLEFASPRGLVRVMSRGEVLERDVVRFDLDGAVEVLQRRDFVRVAVVRPFALAAIDGDGRSGEWIDTLTVNLSGNGFLVGGPDTLAVGSEVAFRARLVEDEGPIAGTGRVTRLSDAGHRGIAIEELSERDHRRLVAFIFERERIARSITRDGEL